MEGHFLIFLVIFQISHGIQFLNWGDKCQLQLQGGGEDLPSLTEECDAGKGLICGIRQACECTYKQRYSYDPVSNECRRRIGKPCQFIDLHLHGVKALDNLPFNIKCHENAVCAQLEVPFLKNKKKHFQAGVVDTEKYSMCVCKPQFVPSSDLNACIIPPPITLLQEDTFRPKSKLQFRPPYYTRR
jgi:hypothetical protein